MANYTLERDRWCARERVPNVLFVVVGSKMVILEKYKKVEELETARERFLGAALQTGSSVVVMQHESVYQSSMMV